jgi:Fe-S cluster assembly iron-binding protein IscA
LPESRIRVTSRALDALRAEGLDPARTVLVIRHVLGCGGSGYRLTFSDRPIEGGRLVEAGGGLVVSLDELSFSRLDGAAIDYDPEKETEGFLLDHPDAAFAAFC